MESKGFIAATRKCVNTHDGTLTEGTDTIQGNPGNLVGSNGTVNISGDDIIIAGTSVAGGVASNNLGAGDVIDAGAGFDTLRIINQDGGLGGATDLVPNLTNVERIDVQAISATTLNLINANGVEEIFNVNSTADVTVTEINDDVVLGFQNTDTNMTAVFDEDAITDDAIDVALIGSGEVSDLDGATELNADGAVTLTVDASDNEVDAVNVSATGAASRLVLNVTSDDDITSLNITGAAAGSNGADAEVYVNAGNVAGSLTDVTSTSTGDVTLVIGGNTEDLTVTTAGGDDRLVLSAGTFNARDSVNLGAGEDALELHFGAGDINLTGKSAIVAGVNAADGVETLIVDAWNSAGAINLNASLFTDVQDFVFDDTNDGDENFQDELSGPINVTEVSADNTFTIGTDLLGAASFTSDDSDGEGELNLTVLGDIGGGLTATDFSDINLTVGTNELLEDVIGEDAENIDLNVLTLDDDATVTIVGEANRLTIAGVVTTTAGGFSEGVTIDAAAFDGDADITGGFGADTLIGGSGDDVLRGGENETDTVLAGENPNGANDIVVTTVPGQLDNPFQAGNQGRSQVSTVAVSDSLVIDDGDTFTLTVNGVALTYEAVAGDDARDVELGLLDAFNQSTAGALNNLSADFTGGNLVISGNPNGLPFLITDAATNAPAMTVVGAGVDTFTGNGGDDTFFVATTDITEMNGDQASEQADTITDFSDGDLLSFAIDGLAGTEGNYTEGAVGGFGNVQGALTAANSDFAANEDLLYSAQQVGADVYIFANLSDDGEFGGVDGALLADQVVRLEGVTLADLADDGTFIVADLPMVDATASTFAFA